MTLKPYQERRFEPVLTEEDKRLNDDELKNLYKELFGEECQNYDPDNVELDKDS